MRLGTAVAMLAVLLGGCAGGTVVEYAGLDGGYASDYVQQAAASGRFPTAIAGRPSAGVKADSDREVLAALRLPGHFPPAEFVAVDAATARATRLVLRFDAAFGSRPCEVDAPLAAGRGSTLSVNAALCSGDGAL
ncbi:MAG: hypothetical protein FJX68_06585, partial [Alphaproteobacteria bacterium]|nr:hypothetical protein [Alphaproteobacteria bacterium]